ncbi:MAG: type I methionyl aminopeptidase [Granulosicoccus sp.]|nr:type I methionyl aminopeptidase [Granulosicoccus sp.]
MSVSLKTPEQIAKMRVAGRLAAEVLDMITEHVVPGVTTEELNTLCHKHIVDVQKGTPATLGYKGFSKSICTSINQQICHGIPSDRVLKRGDIVNIDVTVIKDGWFGDTSRMYYVGSVAPHARRLCETAYDCMVRGIKAVRPGATLGDIGFAIQSYAEKQRYSVVQEYCGHGIGASFHEDPQVLHYGKPGEGIELRPGMTFTIEPMINQGKRHARVLADGWTVVTKDRSLSAQWEHTVLVTRDGYDLLTLSDGQTL